MNKLQLRLSGLFVVAFLTACFPLNLPEMPDFAGDEGDLTPFTEKTLPVLRRGEPAGTVNIRFYADFPSIPYISVADFQALMLPGSKMDVRWTGDAFELTNACGTATVNTAEDRFSCPDYIAFTNLMDQVQEGMDNAYLDGLPYVHYSHQERTAPAPVVFDFGPYGIDLRSDGTAVFFPFATLADLYADLYYHYAACNGEKVIVADRDDGQYSIEAQEPGYAMASLLTGARSEDMIAYNYGELCFVIDHFYGMPGRSPYEASLAEVGLDKTLEASAEGKQLKSLLLSGNMLDMAAGMEYLFIYLYDGGHSKPWKGPSLISDSRFPYQTAYPGLYSLYLQNYIKYEAKKGVGCTQVLISERTALFPDGATYHKKGDTAICHFDDFHSNNYEAWRAYYAGTGPLPALENLTERDQMAVFLDALKKAGEDPEVKNLVIDLTMNSGGSLDLVVAMTSLMYGDSFGRFVNPLTGEHVIWHYDVDRNFDGRFDANDQDVHYDLNFCILTSCYCFSCGNLLPSLCKDAGILLAGETTGGGSCSVGAYRTAEGFPYQISSIRGRMSDKNWENTDTGITPHVAIEYGPEIVGYFGVNPISIPSRAKFYDLDYLSEIIHEYYK